jgi:hypothetical protein
LPPISWQSQIRLLPTGYRDVFDRLFRMLELYEKRCDRYERTITNLTDELGRRDERIRKIEAGASAETVKVQARAEVARTAFSELALAGRMLLGTKAGLSPEAISVLSAVDKSPELRATLSDPKVVAMLNKPENLKTLALLLQQGAQVDAAPQADSPADPSPNPAAIFGVADTVRRHSTAGAACPGRRASALCHAGRSVNEITVLPGIAGDVVAHKGRVSR